ncbi:MAG: F0F1 ATP synthase subunit A [Azospirillum sp.]|nr:F0F1 ATP synthase subunit A [Azospirillum sp.]
MSDVTIEIPVLFHLGPVPIGLEVVTTWGVMAVLALGAWLGTRRLTLRPGAWQTLLEAVVAMVEGFIRDVIGRDPQPLLPLVGTLFLYIAACNLSPLIPGVKPPTASLHTTAALALVVFFSVHVLGIRTQGVRHYLKGYLEPFPLFLPLNLLGEVTRTFALMVRLCGNIMSHELVLAVLVGLAGLLVPIPFMALGILVGLVQAYIFAILATVFLGAAIGAIERG